LNVPNTISLVRVLLGLVTVGLLYISDDNMRWLAFVLTILVIWGDGLDGYFARKLNQTSKFGAMVDIVGDRVVEMAYWIVFAALNWIPVWVPLLYVVRGTFVDAIRAIAFEQGMTAFGDTSMMKSKVGKFLVASNFSRFGYAIVKAAAFSLLIAAHITLLAQTVVAPAAMLCVYLSCFFCLVRGLPVLIEGRKLVSS
jgi:CDP-diacylglycerol--glycerol-3-phosphate 3-phosphatidyltransferase